MSDVNPYGSEIASMNKFRHSHKIGDRVKVAATGHRGKITNLYGGTTVHVQLDSGHFIHGHTDEFIPEDFPASSVKVQKADGAVNPFGDDEPEALDSTARATLTKAAGDSLVRALEAGSVSVSDRILIERCEQNIRNAQVVTNPYGSDSEDENYRVLKTMGEKYGASTDAGAGSLHKADSRDRVDDLIAKAVDGLRSGKNIILPPECRIPFMKNPVLAAAVKSGRICFDYA